MKKFLDASFPLSQTGKGNIDINQTLIQRQNPGTSACKTRAQLHGMADQKRQPNISMQSMGVQRYKGKPWRAVSSIMSYANDSHDKTMGSTAY